MAFLVEQDHLFALEGAKRCDVKGTVGVHQDDLVVDEGRRGTELGQLVVTARTEGNVGFVVEQQSKFFLDFASLSNGVVFRVLVYLGFGGDEGPGTAEIVVILNLDDGFRTLFQHLKCGMPRFGPPWFASSPRGMMDLGDGQLKRIVHFKLFIAVEGLRQTIEKSIQTSPSFAPFPCT